MKTFSFYFGEDWRITCSVVNVLSLGFLIDEQMEMSSWKIDVWIWTVGLWSMLEIQKLGAMSYGLYIKPGTRRYH